MKSLVIIPTYNESENIGKMLAMVPDLAQGLEVLVIDDGSPDGTADLVKEMMAKDERIHLIQRSGKLGLGSAYVRGFEYSDLVIGSRYSNGVNIVNWPIKRLLISYFASKYVRIITGMPVKDPTGGFKCFNRKVLEAINLDKILSDGYAFQVEMNYRAWSKGFSVKEIPIIFTERINGVSKMSKHIVWEAAWMIWYLRILKLLNRL